MKRTYVAVPYEFETTLGDLSDSEFGRIVRALIRYSAHGDAIALTGNERLFSKYVQHVEDSFREELENSEKARKERASRAAEARWENAKDAKACASTRSTAKRKEPKENTHNTHNDSIYINNNNNNNNINNNTITSPKVINHYRQYGEYGWVKLTDEQYQRLLTDLGESLLTDIITKLDEYCQSNNNKNKYKDFNLVIRKAVREHWFERTGSTKRPNSKEFDERDVSESEFASGFYADVMNRKRPGEGA